MVFSSEVVEIVQKGGLVVIPTDTLYGIVCSAHSLEAVEKLYAVRGRTETKPCIILIDSIDTLDHFGIVLDVLDKQALQEVWPGKVSVVFDCSLEKWAYLHRGTKTLAFRMPDDSDLLALLRETGPLLAPSANTQGFPPAHTLEEAKEYFKDAVTAYVDAGYRDSLPSTVARRVKGQWEVLREGAVTF